MFLTRLAADPRTNAALLDALHRHVVNHPKLLDLRAALVTNQTLPLAVRIGLATSGTADARRQVIGAAASALPVTDLLAMLADEHAAPVLSTALRVSKDEDGHLARSVLPRATGPQVTYALLNSPTCPHDVKMAAIERLTGFVDAKPTSYAAAHIAATLTSALGAGPEQRAAAWKLLQRLLDVRHKPLRDALHPVHRTAALHEADAPGRDALSEHIMWLRGAKTGDVIGYATELGSVRAWTQALREHPDPSGELAAAAWYATDSATIRRDLATRATAPAWLRRKAMWHLTKNHELTDRIATMRDALLRHDDISWAVRYVRRFPHIANALRAVAGRADLTAEHLNVLDEAYTIHLDLHVAFAAYANEDAARAAWALTLSTHPNANLAQRAKGRDLFTQRVRPTGFVASQVAAASRVAGACTDLGEDEASALRSALSLPVPAMDDNFVADTVGVAWLTSLAVGHISERVTTTAGAQALVSLTDSFTGTLGELVDVATAIGS